MAFENLHEEIEEMFEELQTSRDIPTSRDRLFSALDSTGAPASAASRGFRVFMPNPPKTREKMNQLSKEQGQRRTRQIRERLLAGERKEIGGKGRPPTEWIRIAAELGIELPRVKP